MAIAHPLRKRCLTVIVVVFGCLAASTGWAETKAAAAAKAAAKQSEPQVENPAVEKKLKEILKNQEQILANQQTILEKFAAVMEELRIIKVRATIRGGS